MNGIRPPFASPPPQRIVVHYNASKLNLTLTDTKNQTSPRGKSVVLGVDVDRLRKFFAA